MFKNILDGKEIKNIKKKTIINDKIIKFFAWLYAPDDFITIDEIMNMQYTYEIPQNIVLEKIIQWLLKKNLSDDDIIKYIKDQNILSFYDNDKLIQIIMKCKELPIHSITNTNAPYIHNIANAFITQAKIKAENVHYGSPHPDATFGRPRLEWNECYHRKCHKKFNNTDELKKHLDEQFVHGLHKFHEDIVASDLLTPEKIINSNMKYCPAVVCNMSNIEMDPQKLCDHFRAFGIPPFWKSGDTCEDLEKQATYTINMQTYKSSYGTSNCPVCMENIPDLIYLPCNHNSICFTCNKTGACPMCRVKIEKVLPY